MRKKELLSFPVLTATDAIKKMVREDAGEERRNSYSRYAVRVYGCYTYYRAKVENEILRVAVFSRKHVAEGRNDPDMTIFIDRKERKWMTYEHGTGRWLSAMIDNLPDVIDEGRWYQKYTMCSDTETKAVNEYLGKEGSVRNAVMEYQREESGERLQKKNRKELDYIDGIMENVPKLPGDFEDWIWQQAYRNDTSIIYKPGKKVTEGYCTHCQKMVPVRVRPHHLDTGKCLRCRTQITYRSYGKQNGLENDKYVGIIQQLNHTENYILRVFYTKQRMDRGKEYRNPHRHWSERYRFLLNKNFIERDAFVYMEYKNTGRIRWCKAQASWYYNQYRDASSWCVPYERNMDKLLEGTEARYVPMRQLLRDNPGTVCHPENFMEMAIRYPDIEKFIKLKLNRISMEILKGNIVDDVAWGAIKPEHMLRIDKELLRMAIKRDATKDELKILQAAHIAGIHPTEEQVEKIGKFYKHSGKDDIAIFLRQKNIEKTLNYMDKIWKERGGTEYQIRRDYEDYMEQLNMLGMPLDKHNRFPANFQQTHARLSEIIAEKEEELKKADTRKKNRILKKMIRDLKKLYYGESEDFVIVWPESKEDFQKEGQQQHNCVGGYFDKMVSGRTVVFFLRKKESVNEPFCTVEFTNGNMQQCRTKFNGGAPQEAMQFMKTIEKNYQKEQEKRMQQAERQEQRLAAAV